MDFNSPCRSQSVKSLAYLRDFINENPGLLSGSPPASHDACLRICSSISHLSSRKSRDFFIWFLWHAAGLRASPRCNLILRHAVLMSVCNWALVRPYLQAVLYFDDDDLIEVWSRLARYIASLDIDVAVAFVKETPRAIETLGIENIESWGEQALRILQRQKDVWRAARAYLVESSVNNCSISNRRWEFFLGQAARISQVSPSTAEDFIRLGSRLCLLLSDEETEKWVSEGLARNLSEAELSVYFSGSSMKALEARDSFASGVALRSCSNLLSLLCEALLGRQVKIRSNASLLRVKGFTGGAATDGRTVYLPDSARDFALFKLMALHQSMLLGNKAWKYELERTNYNPAAVHLEADHALLDRLPNLLGDMRKFIDGSPASSYPAGFRVAPHKHMLWWGDILPELVNATDTTIQFLREKAEDETQIPPEVLEALLASMMADGQRDTDDLWKKLMEILDSVELTSPDAEDLQEQFKTFFYKEWDNDLSDYKMDWCLVRQRLLPYDPNPFVNEVKTRLQGLITLIRRQFARLKPERFKKYREQPMGDDLDIDALIKAFVDMRSGSFLSENVYIRRDKRIRDVAVLFLLDMSQSTSEMINGKRVIDIQKESMALMAEALDCLGDPHAILGFTSEGRFRVDLFVVKDFAESYSERVQNRLGNIEPKGLTRLGAVVRHGAYRLNAVQSAIKLMVILTDGRPYDLGYGSLDYAIQDTKKAIQECRNQRIHPFIITSDKKGASYLRQISPQTQSIILPKAELLPAMLPAIYKRLTV